MNEFTLMFKSDYMFHLILPYFIDYHSLSLMFWYRRRKQDVTANSRICSCHFPNGNKEALPNIFFWNDKKRFTFKSPEKRLNNILIKFSYAMHIASPCYLVFFLFFAGKEKLMLQAMEPAEHRSQLIKSLHRSLLLHP